MQKQTQPGAAVAGSDQVDLHMAAARLRKPGITEVLKSTYGFTGGEISNFVATLNCGHIDEARAILLQALARKAN